MYYYGCNSGYTPYTGYNQGYGYGTGYGAAIVLVLFILLVIYKTILAQSYTVWVIVIL